MTVNVWPPHIASSNALPLVHSRVVLVQLLARVWVQLPSFPTANSFPPGLTLPCGRNRVSVLLLLLQATIDNLLQQLAEHRVPFRGALNLGVTVRAFMGVDVGETL